MAKIIGIENLTSEQILAEVKRGGKFVVFTYCISIIIMSFKRPTDIYFIKSGDGTFAKSMGFNLVTLLLGWWGIPWGPIYSVSSLFTNLSGGKDVTAEMLSAYTSDTQVESGGASASSASPATQSLASQAKDLAKILAIAVVIIVVVIVVATS